MTKTHRVETIEEYDTNGKLVKKTVTEETEESDISYTNDPSPWWQQSPVYNTTTTTTNAAGGTDIQ